MLEACFFANKRITTMQNTQRTRHFLLQEMLGNFVTTFVHGICVYWILMTQGFKVTLRNLSAVNFHQILKTNSHKWYIFSSKSSH